VRIFFCILTLVSLLFLQVSAIQSNTEQQPQPPSWRETVWSYSKPVLTCFVIVSSIGALCYYAGHSKGPENSAIKIKDLGTTTNQIQDIQQENNTNEKKINSLKLEENITKLTQNISKKSDEKIKTKSKTGQLEIEQLKKKKLKRSLSVDFDEDPIKIEDWSTRHLMLAVRKSNYKPMIPNL
jgi:hypothetical protein